MGTGIHRLVQHPELLRGAERVDIVLTHFHLDHVIGLSYLPGLALAARSFVWGPGQALYNVPTREVLARLVGAPLFATGIEEMTTEVAEIDGESLRLPSFELRSRRPNRHPHPTPALRVDDMLSYCTDTAYDPGNVAFAKGSALLLHEAWYSHDGDDPATHPPARPPRSPVRLTWEGSCLSMSIHSGVRRRDSGTRRRKSFRAPRSARISRLSERHVSWP